MTQKKKNNIFVIYVGVAGVRSDDISDYVHEVCKRITPETIEGEIITIPIQAYDTRIECINPKYITEKDLIDKHTELIKNLEKELSHQLNEIKEQNEKN